MSENPKEPKIRIEHLTKIFGSQSKEALKMLQHGAGKDEILDKTGCGVGVADASFTVAPGEIVVVMGLSGSGKSTLVRCINRLIEPTAGKIFIDDEDITALPVDRLRQVRLTKLGMVFQNFALFPHRTVCQNAEYGLEIQGLDPAKRREKAMIALEQVGLKGWEDYYPVNLSGGMQQRVGLARALALDPDILLMDEAFSALDPLIRGDMQDELINLQSRMHKTIVFISHDLDEALKLGDRIVLMKDGAIVQIGTAEQILTNPANDYVARFVENVDITKVLTAESVMIKPKAVVFLSAHGPKSALRFMQKQGLSQIFVHDAEQNVIGYVTADTASEASSRGETELHRIMQTDFVSVLPETPAAELIPIMADLPYPLPVVSADRKLRGVIIRGSLLAALAERGRNNNA
ncbi:glycine betaine/proline transport system ATP-binding protein [Desulfonatronum thiosulfatophilum]|uniref:Glycine betaine/proline transport system ATP-binding protein n=1 Tax=Desulfonatronum thiosulfatophilum TaxID=617002 RepID=A0A1G6BPI9_9BACT|nr:glycine betaine/L-proline ABC transporter ATP-binding protein [Desulfonatronum thiosulfatophilum]SDB22541.1 glycine betaine/proline transport system ATP-binding protein [Desulfonatronum thiosulfatophilum]